MRFGRRPVEEFEHIQMAPLIDVVFITLVFFMTTYAYSRLESAVNIQLPTADTAKHILERTRGEIYINLRADGRIIVNDRVMGLPELQNVLNRVAKAFPGGAVIIRGDRAAALGQAIAVLNCCRKADIENVSFAAVKDEPKHAT